MENRYTLHCTSSKNSPSTFHTNNIKPILTYQQGLIYSSTKLIKHHWQHFTLRTYWVCQCYNFDAVFCIKKFYANRQYNEIFLLQHYICKINYRIQVWKDPGRFFWSLAHASRFNHVELEWSLASVKKVSEISVVTLRHAIVFGDIKLYLILILKYSSNWKKEKCIFSTSAFVQRLLNHGAEIQDEMETTKLLWPLHSEQ